MCCCCVAATPATQRCTSDSSIRTRCAAVIALLPLFIPMQFAHAQNCASVSDCAPLHHFRLDRNYTKSTTARSMPPFAQMETGALVEGSDPSHYSHGGMTFDATGDGTADDVMVFNHRSSNTVLVWKSLCADGYTRSAQGGQGQLCCELSLSPILAV